MPSKFRQPEEDEASAPLLGAAASPTSPPTRSHERSAHITLPISSIAHESSAPLLPRTQTDEPTSWWMQMKSSALGRVCIAAGTLLVIALFASLGYMGWKYANPIPPHRPSDGPAPPPPPSPPPKDLCLTPECVMLAAKFISSINQTQNPCHDFYEYSCGRWEETHDIPDDRTRIGVFSNLAKKNTRIVRHILEGRFFSSKGDKLDTNDLVLLKLLRSGYGNCMSESAIEALGPAPLYDFAGPFNATFNDNYMDQKALVQTLVELQLKNIDVLFSTMVEAHPDVPNKQVVYVSQPSLVLPSKNYYLDSEYLHIYETTVRSIFETLFPNGPSPSMEFGSVDSGFFGRHPPVASWAAVAKDIVHFETQLAELSWPTEDIQDPLKTNNPMNMSQLERITTTVLWKEFFSTYFQRLALPTCPSCYASLIVMAPSYFEGLDAVLAGTSVSTLNFYFTMRAILSMIDHVDTATLQLIMPFRAKVEGLIRTPPRFETCIDWIDSGLGMVTGRYYVLKQFFGASKLKAMSMVTSILHQFQANLDANTWMDQQTKEKAQEKLKVINLKIGYPNYIMNTSYLLSTYGTLNLSAPNHFQHALMLRENKLKLHWHKLFKPTDRDEWEMLPHTVNAYYNPSQNEIVFPAGILQPPFFHVNVPDAVNYGAIGAVIGHEILHGFDNHGRHYDAMGRLVDWWSPSTAKSFDQKSQCFVEQYSQFYILDPHNNPVYVNGNLTLGENLADNGGIKQSFEAFQRQAPSLRLPGLSLSPDQLFFLSFAHVWCGKMSPQYALLAIRMDPHSPYFVRVNAAAQNSDAFSKIFQCPAKSPMRSASPCKLF